MNAPTDDYVIHTPGGFYMGLHLLVEVWGSDQLDDVQLVDQTLRQAALDAGATILHSHFHPFTPNSGVSGVVVLAESHISIHTWPERGYAAVDIFMSGACDPHKALPRLFDSFQPKEMIVGEYRRGWKPRLRSVEVDHADAPAP